MGTSTVPSTSGIADSKWGRTCNSFLEGVREHPSKASSGYYYKSHVAYFGSLYRSLRELARVLKDGGHLILVVQDSYYKDIHNDLPLIVAEMAEGLAVRVGSDSVP